MIGCSPTSRPGSLACPRLCRMEGAGLSWFVAGGWALISSWVRALATTKTWRSRYRPRSLTCCYRAFPSSTSGSRRASGSWPDLALRPWPGSRSKPGRTSGPPRCGGLTCSASRTTATPGLWRRSLASQGGDPGRTAAGQRLKEAETRLRRFQAAIAAGATPAHGGAE